MEVSMSVWWGERGGRGESEGWGSADGLLKLNFVAGVSLICRIRTALFASLKHVLSDTECMVEKLGNAENAISLFRYFVRQDFLK